MTFFKKFSIIAMLLLLSISFIAYAEDAPVFEVDNYPPQFDEQADSGIAATSAPSSAPSSVSNQNNQNQAPGFSSAPISAPILSNEQRMTRLEQQMSNLQHSDASTRVDALQNEVQNLRGQVENLTHQIQQMQTQQKAMYSDLDKRINKRPEPQLLSSTQQPNVADTETDPVSQTISQTVKKPAPVVKPKSKLEKPSTVSDVPDTSSVAPKATTQPNAAEEQQIYQTAYDLIRANKYDAAIDALQNMLIKYPSGQFAANAHFWLGELYGLQGKNNQSAIEFAAVVNNYSDSPKVADAQLKLGMIYSAQFKWSEAKTAFKKVISHYPGTASSRLASEQLKQIKLAGH